MVQGLGFRLLRCVAVGVGVGVGVMGVLAGAARAEPFARRPYAQSVSTDEVVLKWTQGTGGALLRYGPAGADREAAAEEVVFREAASPTGEHELRLTGLRHSTRYQYSVDATDGSDDGWGRGAAVALGEFSTAVLRDEPFSFLLYGDNRSSEPDHRRVVEAMARESADFVLNTGDIVEHGSAAEYDGFFRVEAPLLARVVLFPTLGNHELSFGLGAGAWEHAFVTPSTTSGTRRYYSFDYGNSRFVVLDFNSATRAQTAWLERTLAEARAQGRAHLFVALHHGPFDSGAHGENAVALRDWAPIFARHHVDLVMSGHDHDYERGQDPRTRLRYVVSGGGGAPLYGQNGRRAYQQRFVSTLHYVRIRVAGSVVSLTAVQPDGVVIDELSFRSPPVLVAAADPSPAANAPPRITAVESPAAAASDLASVAFDARFGAAAAGSSLALGLALVVWRRRQG